MSMAAQRSLDALNGYQTRELQQAQIANRSEISINIGKSSRRFYIKNISRIL